MAENKVITYPAFGRDDVDIRAEDTVCQGFVAVERKPASRTTGAQLP